MNLKPEVYSGITIVFEKNDKIIFAGFPKRPHLVSAFSKNEAFKKMKSMMNKMHPIVLETYKKNSKVMTKMEDM